jgi:four helix bundle protein
VSLFSYRELEAWHLSMALVEVCYAITADFPPSERYGAASQVRRAAVSIPSNVAEGHCRHTTNAYLNHISIALGSYGELCTLIEICRRVRLMSSERFNEVEPLLASVGRVLHALQKGVERRRT